MDLHRFQHSKINNFQSQTNIEFWRDIYNSFNGILIGCEGYNCPVACCKIVNVIIFPQEYEFLVHIYGDRIKKRIKDAGGGYYLLHNCSDGKNCLFFKYRPLVCRTYPCVAIEDDELSGKMTFYIDKDYCPHCPDVDSDYTISAYIVWEKVCNYLGLSLKPRKASKKIE